MRKTARVVNVIYGLLFIGISIKELLYEIGDSALKVGMAMGFLLVLFPIALNFDALRPQPRKSMVRAATCGSVLGLLVWVGFWVYDGIASGEFSFVVFAFMAVPYVLTIVALRRAKTDE